ncbi:MarR family winged helix-turn-helix transcriptional regulator [Planomicrobium sp. YIM 101495]|uniref:MarR family winged helix-turn-helix transcriptional regulator n=1 Tax=Planomicrobium sp. YIM 101495 TaxID=2665160 RepID=UPI0012BA1960|nr:MarR family transcriptional regulator [Planomicrobium sp. YIM 101495]MTD30620.1 MarR family transcriptional regulator [Planomicrobium sp. YIM 101495]
MKLEQQLCFEVYRASSNFTKLYARVLEPFSLTFPQYLVLLVLWEEDAVPMKDIGTRLGLGTGTLNPIISRMQTQGWVEKSRSSLDKRATLITLTDRARNEHKAICRAIQERLETYHFFDIDAIQLMKNLKNLNAKFAEMKIEQEENAKGAKQS